MRYECGCFLHVDDEWSPTCEDHGAPLTIDTPDDDDIEWAINLLEKQGVLLTDEDDE